MNEKKTFRQKVMQAKGKKGFTLVELVIVIAVLAIIAFIAIPTVSHVIENANASADASNAQAVETAIKTAQSECAANATTHSDRADEVIKAATKGTGNLSDLLSYYGVSIDVISHPKVTDDIFSYNPTTGKVVAQKDVPTGSVKIDSSTLYTSDQTKESTAAAPLSATIGIKTT